MQGRVHLVGGDDVDLPGHPGLYRWAAYLCLAIHPRGQQRLPPYVLASDNVYLYRNLSEHKPSATFSEADYPANLKAQRRMIGLAGSADRVIPGHDALQFQKFPTQGRVATIQ